MPIWLEYSLASLSYGGAMDPSHLSSKARLADLARRAMRQRGLLPDFSPAVLEEMRAIEKAASPSGPDIRDLKALPWASIDNDDSRDLDQLSVAQPGANGSVRILVAVADVDAVVKKGSAIDSQARVNTTSVYTAAQVFPMIPERLSTDLTSLGEGQERLALVTDMLVKPNGELSTAEIYEAVVHNRAKLAYNSVAAWLDGTSPAPALISRVPNLDENLRIQDRVAQAMKTFRHQNGALSLETTEVRAVFRGESLADLQPEKKNRAKDLIEELMVASNGVAARFLEQGGFPSLRRTLRPPERWDRIVALAVQNGERLPPKPDAKALEDFLQRRQRADPLKYADLSLAVVKLLGRGEYVLKMAGQPGEGHFGLAVSDYAQSTAPNRRFPDIVTQRLLKAALSKSPPPYSSAELSELARHCTEQEDNATKVERQVQKSAAALLLESRKGDVFEAIVTGASPKGTWVRIFAPTVEGKLVSGFEGLDVGDRLRVELLETDVERGFIDFKRVKPT